MTALYQCENPVFRKNNTTGKVILIKCGKRFASQCGGCSKEYLRDTRILGYSAISPLPGLGCKPLTGMDLFFLTLTAPSFGNTPIHHAAGRQNKKCLCGRRHRNKDQYIGYPIRPEAYNYRMQAAFNQAANRLVTRTIDALKDNSRFSEVAYFGVFEIQARGALHFHMLVAVNSQENARSLLLDAVARTTVPTLISEYRARWGKQVDIQHLGAIQRDGENSKLKHSLNYITKLVNYMAKDVDSAAQNSLPLGLKASMKAASELYSKNHLKIPDLPIFVGQSGQVVRRSRNWGISRAQLHKLRKLYKHKDIGEWDDSSAVEYIASPENLVDYRDENNQKVANNADLVALKGSVNPSFSESRVERLKSEQGSSSSVYKSSSGFYLSPEQAAVVDSVIKKQQPITVVTALAGTGKTTMLDTLVTEFSDRNPVPADQPNILYLSLLRNNASDFQERGLPVKAINIHKLAYSILSKKIPSSELSEGIERAGLDTYYENLAEAADISNIDSSIVRISSKQQAFLVDSITRKWLNQSSAEPDLSILNRLPRTIRNSIEKTVKWLIRELSHTPLDFGFPAILKLWTLSGSAIPASIKLLIVDEAQDMPPALVPVVEKFIKRGGQIIVVGDPYQNINSFTGASSDIFYLKNAVHYSLSKSFRFGENIAQMAQGFLPATAPLLNGCGSVGTNDSRAILTLTNKEAIGNISETVRQGLKPTSTAYPDSTLGIVAKLKALPVEKHEEYFSSLKRAEHSKYSKNEIQAAKKLANHPVKQYLVPSWKADITVSTVHSAKGKEWDTVILAPSIRKENTPINIKYVAVTRARKEVKYL